MRIRAVCVCRNEADIIRETLLHATSFCDEIYVYDLGSTDETVRVVRDLENERIHLFDSVCLPYHDGRHVDVWRSLWKSDLGRFDPQDWYMILDADEHLVRDPRPALFAQNYSVINVQSTWKIDHYYTQPDHQSWLDGNRHPCVERLKWFRLSSAEPRFFRCNPGEEWPCDPHPPRYPLGRRIPPSCRYHGWTIMLNRHFKYRCPEQISRRFETRDANIVIGGTTVGHWVSRPLHLMIRPIEENFWWDDRKYLWNLPPKDLARVLKWSGRTFLANWTKLVLDKFWNPKTNDQNR